jgi:phosphinothricin acetyltransferase
MSIAPALRPARREDCVAIRDIYNHYVLHDTCTFALEPETLDERLAWFDTRGPEHPVIVAEAAGAVVGWASLNRHHPRGGYRRTVEDSVYVAAGELRRGIGGALLLRLVELAREHGHHTILAGICTEKEGSLAAHARHGFVEVARFREVGFKFGRWLDVAYLQRLL